MSPEIVALNPVPVTPPGLIVQLPAGNPLNIMLPVGVVHVGWVGMLAVGDEGTAFTVNVYVATAAAHGLPNGLSVVTVIITVLPPSPAAGI